MNLGGSMDKALATVPEVATAISMSPAKVWQLVASGELRSVKVGKSRRIPVVEVTAFVERHLNPEN
jgi:excisionase family DNA binding protein